MRYQSINIAGHSFKGYLNRISTLNKEICWDCIYIALFSMLLHGILLLLNDGIYWDDWLAYTWLKHGNYSYLLQSTYESGFPPFAWLIGLLDKGPNLIFSTRLFTILSLITTNIVLYLILRKRCLLNRFEGILIILFHMSYPAYQGWVIINNVLHTFAYCLFMVAAYLAFDIRKSIVIRIIVDLLFVFSFSFNSLLVFYWGFFLLFILINFRSKSINKNTIFKFIYTNLDLLLLPFLYWVFKENVWPRYGLYADYNQFIFSPTFLIFHMRRFFFNGIVGQFQFAFASLAKFPFIIVWVGLILGLFYLIRRPQKPHTQLVDTPSINPLGLLECGIVLAGLAILPYVLVGKSPSLHGWEARHAFLLQLPVAIILTSFVQIINSFHFRFVNWATAIAITFIILAFSLSTVKSYIDWEAYWIKTRSIIANLADFSQEDRNYSIYWVDDQASPDPETYYPFFVWSANFKEIWGGTTRIASDINLIPPNWLQVFGPRYIATPRYFISELDLAGCQALIIIEPGIIPYNKPGILMQYYYLKYFKPDGLEIFLSGLTHLKTKPIYSEQATHCDH